MDQWSKILYLFGVNVSSVAISGTDGENVKFLANYEMHQNFPKNWSGSEIGLTDSFLVILLQSLWYNFKFTLLYQSFKTYTFMYDKIQQIFQIKSNTNLDWFREEISNYSEIDL